MVDVLDVLVSFLCQGNSGSTCQQFISQYPDTLNQLFFFFFFPTILIILFITVLAVAVTDRLGVSYKLLLGVAFYMFIILSGWYPAFLWLSTLWYIGIIIILGIYVFFKKLIRGGGGGKSGGTLPGIGGGKGGLGVGGMLRHGAKQVIGKKGTEKAIEAGLRVLESHANNIENPAANTDVGTAIAMYEATKRGLETNIKQLEEEIGYIGEKTITQKYWDRITALDKRVQKARSGKKAA